MITAASLQEYKVKELAEMAKRRGVTGWHAMRKEELVAALVKLAKKLAHNRSGGDRGPSAKAAARPGARPSNKTAARQTSAPTNGKRNLASADKPTKPKSRGAGDRTTVEALPRGSSRPLRAASAEMAAKPAAKGSPLKPTSARVDAAANKRPHLSVTSSHREVASIPTPSIKPVAAKSKSKTPRPASPDKPASSKVAPPSPPAATTDPAVTREIRKMYQLRAQRMDLTTSTKSPSGENVNSTRDRIVLMVRDPYWMHAFWEITSQSVSRAQAAMAELWHSAEPVLRLLEVGGEHSSQASERIAREIAIHGGVQNWYIEVVDPPRTYRAEIGYRAEGKYFSLARSNVITTPAPGSSDSVDHNWSDVASNCDRIFALSGGHSETGTELRELFEERLRRPMGSPMITRFGVGAEQALGRRRGFVFDIDAEMIVFGRANPDTHVALAGEPVKLETDGSFMVRVSMPDRRQVIPVVACSSDGLEQQTIVLAVERNTKVLEAVTRDEAETN